MIEFFAHLATLVLTALMFHRYGQHSGYRRGVNDLRDYICECLAPDRSLQSLEVRLLAILVRASELGVDKQGRVS